MPNWLNYDRMKPREVEEATSLLLTMQGGRCGVCGLAAFQAVLDHDHLTGVVRGVLCNTCNSQFSEWVQKHLANLVRYSLNDSVMALMKAEMLDLMDNGITGEEVTAEKVPVSTSFAADGREEFYNGSDLFEEGAASSKAADSGIP